MENIEKQIEEIADLIYDNTEFDTMWSEIDASAKAIYNAGYRKQSEWISADERLPTDERNVLAYYGFDRGDGDLGMMFIGVLSYFAYDPNPHFQHESMGLRVTHWMPLPEAPKGGEGK